MINQKNDTMNNDQLKKSAEEAKQAASDFIHSPQVQGALDKGKDVLEKGKQKADELMNNPKVQDAVKKGKEHVGNAIDKLEDFVGDKTAGKGILGFGAKDKQ